MRKGAFEHNDKPDKTKVIQVLADNDTQGKGMTIIRDDTRIIKVTGNTGEPTDKPPIDFNNPPPDTVIFTHTSPTCGYYYWSGRWYYR